MTAWVDPEYLGAVVALAWAQSQAEARREERSPGAGADPCLPCCGVGSTVLVASEETSYVVPCGPCVGTGARRPGR